MRNSADNNPNAQLLIRALRFSSGASWITTSPVPVENYSWEDMEANGLTELGKAFDLLAAQLSIPPMPARALPPVIVLLSDGQPTDDYKKSLDKLKGMPWFRKAVKIAISIGQDADDDVLIEFTGNKELVLQANNATALAKMIKWASTTASMVSAPSSKPMNFTPVSAPAASTPAASVPADEPFAPANNGAPLVLDMSNIPNPDDFDEGAVW
nr:tellurium resistance protein [uncultured Marvinbryantia sp.]